MKTIWQRLVWVLAIAGANIGLDQWTKVWAREHLANQPARSYWNDFFRLVYVENRGAFLSMGSTLGEGLRYWVLHIFPVALLAGLTLYTVLGKQLNRWQLIGMSFIIGGGVSNIYDRLLYGQVTDFMNMGLFGLRTGIFNFADVSIMVGLVMLLPFAFGGTKKAEPTPASTEEE
ncbi:MAG: signal peptidase II [Lewinella sp.]|nr:signal peptidase II [Lewinella sp.]